MLKPLNESSPNTNFRYPNADGDNQPESDPSPPPSTSIGHLPISNLSFQKPSSRRRHKRGPKARVVYAPKPDLSSKPELGSPTVDDREAAGVKEEEKIEGNGEEEVGEGRIDRCETSGGVDDVLGRLSELQLGAEEVELSREQMNANDQLQEDEIMIS